MTHYNELLNITQSIINYTTINNKNNYNLESINQTANQVCFTIYTMFNNTNTIPEYKSFLYFLFTSINTTLHCNFTYTPYFNTTLPSEEIKITFDTNELISKKYLRSNNSSYFTYETIVLLIIGILISKVISMYILKNKNIKLN